GSTGVPKGSAIPQRAVVRLVRHTTYASFAPGERIAQASNTAFDAATYEIWGALLNGGCLVGLERETLLDADRLAVFLRERRIGQLFLTTGLFQPLVAVRPDAFASLTTLLVGGEAMDPQWLAAVGARPARLFNIY